MCINDEMDEGPGKLSFIWDPDIVQLQSLSLSSFWELLLPELDTVCDIKLEILSKIFRFDDGRDDSVAVCPCMPFRLKLSTRDKSDIKSLLSA